MQPHNKKLISTSLNERTNNSYKVEVVVGMKGFFD